MTNQTIATVPADVSDEINLKRFLLELIENLDVVLGFKGDAKYVDENQLASAVDSQSLTLAELNERVAANLEAIEALQESSEEQAGLIEQLQDDIKKFDNLLATDTIDATYHDFNSAAWAALTGKSEFTTLGSNLTNAPFVPTPASTYTVYTDSTKTNAAVLQEIVVVESTNIEKYIRVAVDSNWINLAKV